MAESKPFEGKVILITGAARGIGKATATYLAARGAILSLADISSQELAALAKEIEEANPGHGGLTQVVDVCDPESVKTWVELTKHQLGRIDGCYNNAGILPGELLPISEYSLEDWNRVINVNLTGVFNCIKYELPNIEDGGSIVNMASAAGLFGAPRFASYVASKHGVVGLSKAAAVEASPRGVRVNAVCPSFVDTNMYEVLSEGEMLVERAPQLFRRLADVTEIAALVAFLLGPESKFITKASYGVDGGFMG